MGNLPLHGIRVADFSKLLPGPWGTQMLADLGADVIKVEMTTGDPSRHDGPRLRINSAYFASVNRNKRSIVLDLRSSDGLAAAHKLIASCDVVVETFAVGGAARLGIGYEDVRHLREDMIYCSISGFGQTGPLAGAAGHDLMVQASSGMLGVGGGVMPAFQAGDYAAAANAVSGVLAALYRRSATGCGAYLDIAMSDSVMAMGQIALGAALADASGSETGAPIQVWGGNPRYALYATRDGKRMAVSLLEPRLWAKFCQFIGRPDLVFEERPEDRHSNHGERATLYRAALQTFIGQHDAADLDRLMQAQGITVCEVRSAADALANEHARARGVVYVEHDPRDGDVLRLGSALAGSGLVDTRRRLPPMLGEHTEEVLAELGIAPRQPEGGTR